MSAEKRNILLIEPNYQNKYPPIGLMKIASYHRALGDDVRFFKGKIKDFIVDETHQQCMSKLEELFPIENWRAVSTIVKDYIKTKKATLHEDLMLSVEPKNRALSSEWLKYFADYYRKKLYKKDPRWDRVYVTTLFTFYWKITVETINDAKVLVKNPGQLYVGGVMASLLPDEIEEATGIRPLKGLLDKPGQLDKNGFIIDDMPLDYSILEEIDYKYPTGSAYFTFMTKGCTRTCAFCSVPKLEPTYREKVPTIDKFEIIKKQFGEQQHLLLMDNNVLASPKFPEIIQEIKDMGFAKGATFIEPNQLDIVVDKLKEGYNDKAYTKKAFQLLSEFLEKKAKGATAQKVYDVLDENGLLKEHEVTKEGILLAYEGLKVEYERLRDKSPKLRYVDFNQGTDARYVNEENMRLMSEIPIHPLRIAFDYVGMKKQYINAVELAAKYGITKLSNYLLYNFKDKPEDLYERMRINIELASKLNIDIYSFPMKYIPLFGEEAKSRDYIGPKWNRKYIRAIQSVLNVSKGIVASGESFFYKAFGRDLDEFFEILYMPESYIIYRSKAEHLGYTDDWRRAFSRLNEKEKKIAKAIIEKNDFSSETIGNHNSRIKYLLSHYTVSKDAILEGDEELKILILKYEKLCKDDKFVELTLTYDFNEISFSDLALRR